jgi:triosephosphate isomerase
MAIEIPVVVLNFKAYEQAIGDNAVKLANIAAEVAQASGVEIVVAPQAVDLVRTVPIIKTVAQHIDPIKPGSGTGTILTEAAKAAGAIGSLINHSENQIQPSKVDLAVKKLKELGMTSIVCADTAEKSAELAQFSPDFIAVEPPELIGSGISVSTAQPEIITNTVEMVHAVSPDVNVLCGAGISNKTDVKKSYELGAKGVLLASAFTKATDPKAVLENMVEGF